jgi:hypothetical protein
MTAVKDAKVAFRLLPRRSLSSLSVVSAPRKPLPCSVRPRMFLSDRAMAERSVSRSPPPSSSFSIPVPGAAGSALDPASGSSAVPQRVVLVMGPIVLIDHASCAAAAPPSVDVVNDAHRAVGGIGRQDDPRARCQR